MRERLFRAGGKKQWRTRGEKSCKYGRIRIAVIITIIYSQVLKELRYGRSSLKVFFTKKLSRAFREVAD